MAEKEAQRAAAQSELDDLLLVFEDLEDKVARYKVCYLDSPHSTLTCDTSLTFSFQETVARFRRNGVRC